MLHRLSALLCLALLCAGCAGPRAANTAPEPDARLDAAAADVRTVTILRGADGAPATWDQLVADASRADAVLVGELHGQPVGQAFEAALFEDVLARSPSTTGALEFFERHQQAGLDDYLTGVTDEAAMKKATGRSEGSYPSGHRAIVEASKAAGRPVVAANAPRPYVRLARLEGYDRLRGLTDEQRRLFVIPDSLPTGRYRDEFFDLMRGKPDPKAAPAPDPTQDEKIEAMFRSQSMWDATMAHSVARAMDAGGRPVVLIVGRFHTDHAGGLVQALRRDTPNARLVTVSFIGDWPPADGVAKDDLGRADYLVYVGPAGE
jgi:uncharacterized iron-regulated protein